jgi:inner membrane transporter RhtA
MLAVQVRGEGDGGVGDRPGAGGDPGAPRPLTRALAASRRRVDLACALFAGAAVVVLARPQPTTDYLGITLALVAAGCWASYILLNRVIGRRLPGAEGSAAAGVLSSAVPFLADLFTLRRVPAGFFGVFMSVNPVSVSEGEAGR